MSPVHFHSPSPWRHLWQTVGNSLNKLSNRSHAQQSSSVMYSCFSSQYGTLITLLKMDSKCWVQKKKKNQIEIQREKINHVQIRVNYISAGMIHALSSQKWAAHFSLLLAGGSMTWKIKNTGRLNFAMPYAHTYMPSLWYTAKLMVTTLVNMNYGLHWCE